MIPKFRVWDTVGLFDVNGKEIFEGDVIVAMSQGVKATETGVEIKKDFDFLWQWAKEVE